MGTQKFSEFPRIFAKSLNPLKIQGKIQSGVCSKYYNLNSCGIHKLSHWTKLLIKYISSSMQILDIFGIQEGNKFELQNLSNFWIIGKKDCATNWARPSATATDPRSVLDRVSAFRPHVAQTTAAVVHRRAVGFRPP
jgi:hypothetical protein